MLSNDLQRELCERKDINTLNTERKGENNNLKMSNDLHVRNIDATKILCPNTDDITDESIDFNSLPIETFKQSKLTVKLLKGFIHVRPFYTATIPSGQESKIPTIKGNLQEINDEKTNLIYVAYEVRLKPIVLFTPETDVDEEGVNNVVHEDPP